MDYIGSCGPPVGLKRGIFPKITVISTCKSAQPRLNKWITSALLQDCKARLHDGSQVAVKVQCFGLTGAFAGDVDSQPSTLTTGSASNLLQVHKARLHDGRQVAVKVQYLGLEASVAADMTTLSALSTAAAWLFPESFELGWVLDDLRHNLALELDFRLEAENAAKLMQLMGPRTDIIVPAVIPQVL